MPVSLRCVGLCGIDDSVDPRFVAIVAGRFPFAEWGVLFRPDKEGCPRYPGPAWLDELRSAWAASDGGLRLAAHLCGERVNEILRGDFAFARSLPSYGFKRVQINATAVNAVDTDNLAERAENVARLVVEMKDVEFIIQKNGETAPLWRHLEAALGSSAQNLSFLCDESCGRGTATETWPAPHAEIKTGYAGGIGPANVGEALGKIAKVVPDGTRVWIDMESRLRSTCDGEDIFDMKKAFSVLQQVEDDASSILA